MSGKKDNYKIEKKSSIKEVAQSASGLGLGEAQRGVESLFDAQAAPLVIWENELYGSVEKNGITFAERKIYQANKARILGVVNLKQPCEDTFGKDMKTMTTNRLIFDEARESSRFRTIS